MESPILVEDSSNTVIKNCEISGGSANGIEVLPGALNTVLFGNTSRDNQGSGFFIHNGASLTRLEYNKVLANGADGIHNESSTTQAYFNTSCGNGYVSGVDCAGVSPTQMPGDSPVVAGSNICCSTLVPKAKAMQVSTVKTSEVTIQQNMLP